MRKRGFLVSSMFALISGPALVRRAGASETAVDIQALASIRPGMTRDALTKVLGALWQSPVSSDGPAGSSRRLHWLL